MLSIKQTFFKIKFIKFKKIFMLQKLAFKIIALLLKLLISY